MKQYLIVILCILLSAFSVHCRNNYQMLAGEWTSVKIIYPDDPVFKNKKSGKRNETVKLNLSPSRDFFFSWADTQLSGKYEVKGNELMFIGDKEDEVTICIFHIRDNRLVLEMNDGFIFELQKE